MENILITGGAGFIGAHLAGQLLSRDHRVVCVDNFELGKPQNVEKYKKNSNFKLVEMDVSKENDLNDLLAAEKVTRVYHLAANSDIQKSAKIPGVDYKNTFQTTYSILEGMRKNGIKKLFFASTSAVYGEKPGTLLNESEGNLNPISYYGGAKLASEAFISAYAYMNEMEVLIFRFPNVIGPHLTHGVIYDFIQKLQNNPNELEILGDGTQCKPYLYVLDLVEAIADFSFHERKGIELFNIGAETSTTVNEIADMVCKRMDLKHVTYQYTGGNVGWKGDVPAFQYDLEKIRAQGWKPQYTSNEAVWETLKSMKL